MFGQDLAQPLVVHPVEDAQVLQSAHGRVELGPLLALTDDGDLDVVAGELTRGLGHDRGAVQRDEGAVEHDPQRAAGWHGSGWEPVRLGAHRHDGQALGWDAEPADAEVDVGLGVEEGEAARGHRPPIDGTGQERSQTVRRDRRTVERDRLVDRQEHVEHDPAAAGEQPGEVNVEMTEVPDEHDVVRADRAVARRKPDPGQELAQEHAGGERVPGRPQL
jgi:hypothetical protein